MTGSLQIRNNKYHIVINMRDEFGKRKQKWIATDIPTAGNNKRQAEKILRETLATYENNKVAYSKEILFCDYLTDWLEVSKHRLELSTYEGYYNIVHNHIAPYFKKLSVTLKNVEAGHIQKYYTKLLNRGLSPNSVKRHHANIRKALQDAFIQNLIPFNPADRVILPKGIKYKAQYYNKEQVIKLLECSKGTPIETPVLLACYYGLRRSEVAGLKWQNVDFVNKTVTIKSTVVCVKTKMEKDKTKNDSSYRTLPLAPQVEEFLLNLKQEQKNYCSLFGTEYIENDYVCKYPNGKTINPDYISEAFKNLLAKNGLPPIRFHDLRHSCASMFLSLGVDLKKVSDWLGHSSISTTADIYGHVEFKSKVEMGNILAESLTG